MFAELPGEAGGLLNEGDISAPPRSSPRARRPAHPLEDVWAKPLADAIADAGGVLVGGGRIPRDMVQAAFDCIESPRVETRSARRSTMLGRGRGIGRRGTRAHRHGGTHRRRRRHRHGGRGWRRGATRPASRSRQEAAAYEQQQAATGPSRPAYAPPPPRRRRGTGLRRHDQRAQGARRLEGPGHPHRGRVRRPKAKILAADPPGQR